tara:strand:- start:1695 stop:2339 length:645 start_codon:yes stop_codon:yes gene_type:complete
MSEKERISKIISILDKSYPAKKVTLRYKNPLELLIATILAAQCTDVRVNIVTKDLFKKYKKAKDYAKTDLKTLEQEIRSTGFYRNKAKNIKSACQMIIADYNGKVPNTMKDLIKLPGVARKTANIVLSNAYGKAEGIAIDTHAKRVSYRLGFTKHTDPVKIEKDLMGIVPKKVWLYMNHLLVDHGRAICNARMPICSKCPLNKLCPKNGVTRGA